MARKKISIAFCCHVQFTYSFFILIPNCVAHGFMLMEVIGQMGNATRQLSSCVRVASSSTKKLTSLLTSSKNISCNIHLCNLLNATTTMANAVFTYYRTIYLLLSFLCQRDWYERKPKENQRERKPLLRTFPFIFPQAIREKQFRL